MRPALSPRRETLPARHAAHLGRILGDRVADALTIEVRVTPKPGLVDLRNSGSHRDMNVATFLASVAALRPRFGDFFVAGVAAAELPACEVRDVLRPIGLACEEAMLAATGGVNTHKGAIFAFGLLLGAAGRISARNGRLSRDAVCAEVAAICEGLVADELIHPGEPRTSGERLYRAHGLTGARGEAASGFATVRHHGLPALAEALAGGQSRDAALAVAFLHLLANNDDTNIAARGGIAALCRVKAEARALIEAGGAGLPDFIPRLEALDDAFIEKNLSPGGSADLLAMTWLLHGFGAPRGC